MSEPTTSDPPLRARGYAVVPSPRRVALADGAVRLDAGWRLVLDGVEADGFAARELVTRLAEEHGVLLAPEGRPLRLAVRPGALATDAADPACAAQGYRLAIGAEAIELVGNGPAGLAHGVQTLLQLADGDGRESLRLPLGVIEDWPRHHLRIAHWDSKHHQERFATLMRLLDQAARFRINAIGFELEDKFAYPSLPDIGAPGAFTTAQLRELCRYALARHIQIIPVIQSPAHLTYALKHPRWAHLRCDGSNYLACMDRDDVRRFLFTMYDDVIDATPGMEYLHVSTDEVYYAGICETTRRPYDPVNRSLTLVDYVLAAHAHLASRGRRMLFWGEFPLLPEHVHLLPPDLIDGVAARSDYLPLERARGMRQLIYVPIQGEEWLFPSYLSADGKPGSLAGVHKAVTESLVAREGDPLGVFCAAWDDSCPHSETFWAGWAVMAQCAWNPDAPPPDATLRDALAVLCGARGEELPEAYRLLQASARRFRALWELVPSRERGPAYGDSKGRRPIERSDELLPPPPLPDLPTLAFAPLHGPSGRLAERLRELPAWRADVARAGALIAQVQASATRHPYHLEVLAEIASFIGGTFARVAALAAIEASLAAAHAAHAAGLRADAVRALEWARAEAARLVDDRRAALVSLCRTWEKGQYPRNRSADGRDFVHVMDDVKDHFADRRRDLSFMTAPEERIGLESWGEELTASIAAYSGGSGGEAP